MRKITVSQKKILNQQAANGIINWDGLPIEIIERLKAINNTEILWQEPNYSHLKWEFVWEPLEAVRITCYLSNRLV